MALITKRAITMKGATMKVKKAATSLSMAGMVKNVLVIMVAMYTTMALMTSHMPV